MIDDEEFAKKVAALPLKLEWLPPRSAMPDRVGRLRALVFELNIKSKTNDPMLNELRSLLGSMADSLQAAVEFDSDTTDVFDDYYTAAIQGISANPEHADSSADLIAKKAVALVASALVVRKGAISNE